MSTEVFHGKDGWILASYEWDESTGDGYFTYTNEATGEVRNGIRTQTKYFVGGAK